jgi:TetR/AcrR family transcriptional regulator, regulator of autoinduction and epiphytic fitness
VSDPGDPVPAMARRRPDGRTARGERTRLAIVDALLELIAEGELKTAPERIVERAGVSLRTLWSSFKDLEHLYAAANARLMDRQDEAHEPIEPTDPLELRVRHFGEQRARLLEIVAPAARAAQMRMAYSAQLRRNKLAHIDRMRTELDLVFAPELEAAGDGREQLTRALLVSTGSSTWSMMRVELALDLAASTDVMTMLVLNLLQPTCIELPGRPAQT